MDKVTIFTVCLVLTVLFAYFNNQIKIVSALFYSTSSQASCKTTKCFNISSHSSKFVLRNEVGMILNDFTPAAKEKGDDVDVVQKVVESQSSESVGSVGSVEEVREVKEEVKEVREEVKDEVKDMREEVKEEENELEEILFFPPGSPQLQTYKHGIFKSNKHSRPVKNFNGVTNEIDDRIKSFDPEFPPLLSNKTTYPNSNQYIYYEAPRFAMKQDPYVPSYYHPKLGVYYDQFELHSSESHPISFEVGSSISILTSVILEEEKGDSPFDSISSWESRFEEVEKEIKKAFEINNVNIPMPSFSGDYSRFYTWNNPTYQAQAIFGNNMCFNPSKDEIHVFLPQGESLYRLYPITGFFFRWNVKENHYSFPKQQVNKHPGVTIVLPPQSNQIYHSIEGYGSILHKLFAAEDFPFVNTVINTGLSSKDCDWVQSISKIIMNHYPIYSKTKFITADTIRKEFHAGMICFDSVLFIDRMTQGGDGGFLSGYLGTDWLRSILYKHYNLSPKTSTSKPYSLLFMQRGHNRKWINPSLYIETIQREFKQSIEVNNLLLSPTTLEKQIHIFYHTDILLSPHGAGITNCIFLLPHSVVIEVSPPHFTEFCLAGIVLHARLHYIYVPNFDYSMLVEKDLPFPDDGYNKGEYFYVRYPYKQLDINTNVFSIVSAVRDAIAYLDHYQDGYRKVNDYLSPIFH